MFTLPMRAEQGLLWVEPSYILTEGTDVQISVTFSQEWNGDNVTAIFRNGETVERVTMSQGVCTVPRSVVKPAKFTVTLDEQTETGRMTTESLEIYVGPTLKGEQWT